MKNLLQALINHQKFSATRLVGMIFVAILALAGSAQATITLSFQPNSTEMPELDHQLFYTRRIDNRNRSGMAITSTMVLISNISNWDTNPNGSDIDLTDDFINPRDYSDPKWLVKNYTLNFTPAEIQALASYIANGDETAFGTDPDYHFFNDGITFTMNPAPVQKMGALFPIVGLVTAIGCTQLLRRRKMAQLAVAEAEK